MKPPNITSPRATTTVEQMGSTATSVAKQQPNPQGPINATIIPLPPQQINSHSNPSDAITASTTATPTSTLSVVSTTPNNTPLSMNTATAVVAPQPTIIKSSSQNAPVTATVTTKSPAPATSIPMAALNPSHEQQAPLALTTQHQNRAQIQITPTTSTNQIQIQQLPGYQQQTTTAQIVSITSSSTPSNIQSNLSPQISQIPQAKIQATHLQVNTTMTGSPITLTSAPTTSGPTALVIIPQHATGNPILPTKPTPISVKTTQIATPLPTSAAHVGMAPSSQASTIKMQAPISTMIPTMTQVPITAHQNTTLVNRPPQTLPVVPITTVSNINVKSEVNRNTCCLFDNGIRCERVAGNASFSARIQKIVGTKKMNYALDPAARHSYICDNHKAIITVAKKSTALARDTKANARNFTANNNANTPLASQHTNNFNDLNIGPQPTLQHQMNIELLNQNRLANNHQAMLNSIPMRPGTQIAYYSDPHTNQMIPMDTINLKFTNTGGDNVPSSSGGVDIDLQQLQVNTLRRYKRHFRVQTRPGLNKMQLAESLKHHFRTLPVIEKEAITYFVYIVKCHRNKLDHDKSKD